MKGISGRQRIDVYHGLRRFPGATSRELADKMGLPDRMVTARRLPELEQAGWVCRGPSRICSISRIKSVTWFCTRRWLDRPRPQSAAQVPSQSSGEAKPDPGPSQATRQAGRPPVTGLTVEERQRLRRRLADQGDTWAAGFGASHDSPAASGEGG
jgi:hypothetical protein